jgi:hypothetical protein
MKQCDKQKGMHKIQMQARKRGDSREVIDRKPKTRRNEEPLRTLLLIYVIRSFLSNQLQKGKVGRNGPGPFSTDWGQVSAEALTDAPLRLPSLAPCTVSEINLSLTGSDWAALAPVMGPRLRCWREAVPAARRHLTRRWAAHLPGLFDALVP